jgi:hypothetical protein
VYTKPGTIHFWHPEDPKNPDRNAAIRLVSPSLSIGSSSLVPLSGELIVTFLIDSFSCAIKLCRSGVLHSS